MTRVRITGGPWPERIGCEGVIVGAPPGYGRYPWDKPDPRYVVVLLDDDPLSCDKRGCDHSPARVFTCTRRHDAPWSCVMGRDHLEAL